MSNKETVEENMQELTHLMAITFHTTLKEVNETVGKQVYEICQKMQNIRAEERILKPNK